MEKTVIHPNFDQERVGYVINSEFSEASKQKIQQLQNALVQRFGDALLIPEPDTLHITLMDWLAPLVDYSKDKDELYEEIKGSYDSAVTADLEGVAPINVHFNAITAGPEAIFITGTDNGEYQNIRNGFLERVELLPNTKKPPQIIHATVARFSAEIDLAGVQDLVSQLNVDFVQTIDTFRLLRTTDTRMQAKYILKLYQLAR